MHSYLSSTSVLYIKLLKLHKRLSWTQIQSPAALRAISLKNHSTPPAKSRLTSPASIYRLASLGSISLPPHLLLQIELTLAPVSGPWCFRCEIFPYHFCYGCLVSAAQCQPIRSPSLQSCSLDLLGPKANIYQGTTCPALAYHILE